MQKQSKAHKLKCVYFAWLLVQCEEREERELYKYLNNAD